MNNNGSPYALCPIFYPSGAVLMGCKRQCNEICVLYVAFHGRGYKDSVVEAEGIVFEL